MSYRIDPSRASIDFDCMTLDSYTLSVSNPHDDTHATTAELNLYGGLGRISIEKIGDHFTSDDELSAKASGFFPELTKDQIDEIDILLENWRRRSTPLRFLLFSDRAVILEDSDRFIILPAGKYAINVGGGSD